MAWKKWNETDKGLLLEHTSLSRLDYMLPLSGSTVCSLPFPFQKSWLDVTRLPAQRHTPTAPRTKPVRLPKTDKIRSIRRTPIVHVQHQQHQHQLKNASPWQESISPRSSKKKFLRALCGNCCECCSTTACCTLCPQGHRIQAGIGDGKATHASAPENRLQPEDSATRTPSASRTQLEQCLIKPRGCVDNTAGLFWAMSTTILSD